MLFNSLQFALFFPVAVALYWLLPQRFRWAWLLLASCVFYAAFVPAYLLILFAVIGIDYAAGLLIARSEGAVRRRWLLVSIAANLAMLGFFKYFNFFADNARALAGLIGWNLPLPVLQVLLPIGLSFHVFQSLAYTLEVYHGRQAPERHLGLYAVYVMFWPQLVAGPIERPQHLLPQLHAEAAFDAGRVASGLRRMGWGFFKKVVIADRLALLVDPIFAHPADHSGVTIAIAVVFFAFQIYCDFSGYSDIALGAAETMGITLRENFRQPYLARNIAEFWRRWHISLSSWLTDYLFTPLSFAWKAAARWGAAAAALVTFLLAGLWHGANWTYVAFGALHGLAIAGEILTRKGRRTLAARLPAPLWGALGWASTFAFVCLAFVFFRAPSLADAWTLLARLPVGLAAQLTSYHGLRAALLPFGPPLVELGLPLALIGVLMAAEGLQARVDVRAWLAARPTWLRLVAYEALILAVVLLGVFQSRAFIYFEF